MSRAIPYFIASSLLRCAPIWAACFGPLCQLTAEAPERDCKVEACEAHLEVGAQEEVTLFQLYQKQHQSQSRRHPAAAERVRERGGQGQQKLPTKQTVQRDRASPLALAAADAKGKSDLVVHSAHAGTLEKSTSLVEYVYPLFASAAIGIVAFVNRSRGPLVVLVILLFMCSFASVKLVFEWAALDFPFPAFITMACFASTACVSFCILAYRSWQCDVPFPVPTFPDFATMLFPSCLGFALSATCINEALLYTTAAFVEMLGSIACFAAAMWSVVFGLQFRTSLLMPMSLAAAGSAAAAFGEMHFSLIGLLLIVAANTFMGLQGVLQQKLMTGKERRSKYDPCTVAFWSAIPSVFLLFGVLLTMEGLEPCRYLMRVDASQRLSVLMEVMLYCTLFVGQVLTFIFVVREIGSVGMQMLIMAAGVLTVLGGMLFLGETVTYPQFGGYAVMLAGVSWFNAINNTATASDANKEKEKLEGAACPKPSSDSG